ncbi:hypothetical protein KRP22_004349 [Phytophthora ramorum]|nr:hypothetical protein KRP22_13452 [Phytophthora ramorum]
MKIFVPVAVSAASISVVSGTTSWINGLTPTTNTDSYHMKPVHVVHARAQSDAPVWVPSLNAFGSKYGGATDALKFRGALDTVNTASVEGALMYVQAEGIDYSQRADTLDVRCARKNWMQYIVFYDIVFVQTNETVAEYDSEYGPMLPMDGGQCTPISGTNVFSKECVSLNGNSSVPDIGPFVGAGLKDSNIRAPYPNCWWYSFPNTCPLSTWKTKTEDCRAKTRQGQCDFGVLPDGIKCTYNYRILGYVPIDDVVGITAMTYKNDSVTNYPSFYEFCKDGGVEFNTTASGVQSIDFWKTPLSQVENAARAKALVDTYAALLASKKSTQISSDMFGHMQALPTVASLTGENPPCYKNVKECASAAHGCKRELYGQICTVCTADSAGCVKAPTGVSFPTLAKATVLDSESGSTGSSGSGENITTATTSGVANLATTVGALAVSFGLTFLMG